MDAQELKGLFDALINDKKFRLKLDGQQLSYGAPSWSEKLKKGGAFDQKNIAAWLQQNEELLAEMAQLSISGNFDLAPYQRIINDIFKRAKVPCNINLFDGLYTDWMKGLDATVTSATLNNLFLPGSHDSGAYQIDPSVILKNTRGMRIARWFATKLPFVRRIIEKWSCAQGTDIKGQLEHGVRALDLRISRIPATGEFCISHTFYAEKLETVLQQINAFTDAHPDEVLLIHMKPDWANHDQIAGHEGDLIKFIEELIGTKCVAPSDDDSFGDSCTIDAMRANKTPIVAMYKPHMPLDMPNESKIWTNRAIGNYWDNTANKETKITKLQRAVNSATDSPVQAPYGYNPQINEVSMARTPGVGTIIKGLFPGGQAHSLLDLAKTMPDSANAFLRENRSVLVNRHMTVVSGDDVHNNDLVPNIIRHNNSGNR